jgi:hypothetical protein
MEGGDRVALALCVDFPIFVVGICMLPRAVAEANNLASNTLHRRIDIRIYHRTEIAFACMYLQKLRRVVRVDSGHVLCSLWVVLYFTGSKEFNRQVCVPTTALDVTHCLLVQMRLYANKKKSLSLSDHALTAYRLVEGGRKKVKVRTGAQSKTLI